MGTSPRILDPERARALLRALLFALAGLLLNFHPTILSGFRSMQTDPGETRVANYAIEHSYRWMIRDTAHRDYWNPPVYHPSRGGHALAGGGLGALPLYLPWRAAGFRPDTAFQLWMLTVALANFAAFRLLLGDGLRIGWLAADAGAFLFAFGLPRANALHHPQLAPGYFAVLALWALARALRKGGGNSPRFILAFFACWGAQIWCGFTIFWFFTFALAIASLWALASPVPRAVLRAALSGRIIPLALGVLALLALVATPLHQTRLAWLATEPPPGVAGFALVPRIHSWLNAGPRNWVWGWLFSGAPFKALHDEHRLGIGLVSLGAIWWGLRRHSSPLAALLRRTAATIILLTTAFPVNLSLWSAVCAIVPGARAVPRVSMIVLMLLIPAACGLAWAVERLRATDRRKTLGALLLLLCAEQGMTTWSYDKETQRADVRRIEQSLPANCQAFLVTGDNPAHYEVSFKYHADAMLASLRLRLPTLNGPYGATPAKMRTFASVLVPDRQSQARTRANLNDYAGRYGLDPARICWVHVSQPLNW